MYSQIKQPPVRNESIVGAQVYSHSGEFSSRVIDAELPGRGLSFQFIRKYRSSLAGQTGPLGRGWTFNYAKRIEKNKVGILYHDGMGSMHQFTRVDKDKFSSPEGLYSILFRKDDTFILHQRFGTRFYFEPPRKGGRILRIQDRNENQIVFKYEKGRALQITDSFGRKITIKFRADRVVELRDHTGRLWSYIYNSDNCLTNVIQPATQDFPDGTRVRYSYDDKFRLQTITDPKGQTFLENEYDDSDRIISQRHGNGAYRFTYEIIGQGAGGAPIYQTEVEQKNGGHLLLSHNANGQVVERTLFVTAESLSEEDRNGVEGSTIPLTTKSVFNRHGEVISRTFPAGNSSEWMYDRDNPDPLQQGNLLKVTKHPGENVESDQNQITTTFTYEPKFQKRKSITEPRGHTISFDYDERGNLTHKIHPSVTVQPLDLNGGRPAPEVRQLVEQFEYSKGGQMLRSIDARGVATAYYYYPANNPSPPGNGQDLAQNDPDQAGGYLAKVIVDPQATKVTRGLSYDDYGNVTAIFDGKGNPTRWRYNEHGCVISTIARAPFNYEMTQRYDANDNPVEVEMSLEYFGYDPTDKAAVLRKSTMHQAVDYNILNNVIERKLQAAEKTIVETFERDSNENIVCKIQPLGNRTEYRFDERNVPLEIKRGGGTADEVIERYTYTPNGRRRTYVDGRGETTRYDYDGFHRYRGYTNAGGTSKRQWFDAAGNIVGLEVNGNLGLTDGEAQLRPDSPVVSLGKTSYQYDELNRLMRVDRAWRDPATDEPLGQSGWNDEPGIATAITEYGDNNLPIRSWLETNNVLSFTFDGANRIASASDSTGELATIEYDENNNTLRLRNLGPEVDDDERVEQDVALKFDALDRLIESSISSGPPAILNHNTLGAFMSYANRAGAEQSYISDEFGRNIGQIHTVQKLGQIQHDILRLIEIDDNNRVTACIDAGGQRTEFKYDALNRPAEVVYPDGNTKTFRRDGNGNLIRLIDQNGNTVHQTFDALGNLIERRVTSANGGVDKIERYQYDGLNRLVAALAGNTLISRQYDTLSRLVEENQGGFVIQYGYDTAGNRTRIAYPGGQEVTKEYDPLGRVSEVKDSFSGTVARYGYRSSTQLRHQFLGDTLHASFAYEAGQSRLSEVVYQTSDGELVEGSRYQYDAAGNRTQEIQLVQSEKAGERYFYDSANRLVGVQYGVENVDDPDSELREEVQYDLTPVGTWRQKRVLDAQGNLINQEDGITNKLQAYISLGDETFEYDANGNCISKTEKDGAICRYFYDYANRLIHVQCYDPNGNLIQTIEYTYDALGRQISKVVTDSSGLKTEYHSVWNGRQLIEVYVNNILATSFVYGASTSSPVKMIRHIEKRIEESFYLYNGRGWASAIIAADGRMLERYRYDVFGKPFVSEIDGLSIPFGNQGSTSALGNPHIKGGKIWDSDAGLFTGFGKDYVPDRDQFTNPGSDLWTVVDENDYNRDTNQNSGHKGGWYDPRIAAGEPKGQDINWKEVGHVAHAATSAAAGGLLGSAFGPVGAIVGAIIGAVLGEIQWQQTGRQPSESGGQPSGGSMPSSTDGSGDTGGSGSNSGDSKDTETGGIDPGEDNGNGPNDQGSNPGAWARGDGGATSDGGTAVVQPTNPIWGDNGGSGDQGTFYDPKPLAVFMHGSGGYTDPSQEDTGSVSTVIVGAVIFAGNASGTAPQGGVHKPGGVTPEYSPNGEQSSSNHSAPGPDPLYDPKPLI